MTELSSESETYSDDDMPLTLVDTLFNKKRKSIQQYKCENEFISMDNVNNINEFKLINILNNNNTNIIFDFPIKIYSKHSNKYIDVCGILTQKHLFLTSAIKYKLWNELRERTKINSIVNNQNERINNEMAIKLINNLDLIDDNRIIKNNIISYFVGKTKFDIKFNIMLNKNNMNSLSSLFGLSDDMIVNDMKYIKIENGTHKTNKLLEYILMDIAWINKEKINKDVMVITLQKHFPNYLIDILNDKQTEYFVEFKHLKNNINKLNMTKYDPDANIKCDYKLKIIDLNVFNIVTITNQPYVHGFTLQNHKKHTISFATKYKNDCLEWITHLDYAINSNFNFCDFKMNEIAVDNNDDFINLKQEQYLTDSVIPMYKTLKNELLNNKICKLSENEYYYLYKQCIKIKKCKLRANDVGINNNKHNIPKGKEITINHLISLKLYTDFPQITNKFKLHLHHIERQNEFANWRRYLNESCMFYSVESNYNSNVYFYCALEKQLIFNSMRLQIEYPLTLQRTHKTCKYNKNGIILQLKAHSETKYFDYSLITDNKQKDAILIMGSSLQIVGIYINGEWHKKYICALQMFEQIINGYFIMNCKKDTDAHLYTLITDLLQYDEQFSKPPPKYIAALFKNMISRMKRQYNCKMLWINTLQLNQLKHNKLKCLLSGCAEFFNHFDIKLANINTVQQFEWIINNHAYKQFISLSPRQYIHSKLYQYLLGQNVIQFHLKCCNKYSDDSAKCAMFLHLDIHTLPKHIQAVRIEYDLVCDGGTGHKHIYQNAMLPQWLNKDKLYCGFQAFSNKMLQTSTSITWRIGVKIVSMQYKNAADQNLATALRQYDEHKVLHAFSALMEHTKTKDKQTKKSTQLQQQLTDITNDEDVKLPASTTLAIVNSYSREIHEAESMAKIKQTAVMESCDDSTALCNTSVSETFRAQSVWNQYSELSKSMLSHGIKASEVLATYKGYNVMSPSDKSMMNNVGSPIGIIGLKNASKSKKVHTEPRPGSYNIYYRNFLMKSALKNKESKHHSRMDTGFSVYSETETDMTQSTRSPWDKITFDDGMSTHDLESEQKSMWDVSNSEYVIGDKIDSYYTDAMLQRTPMPSSRLLSTECDEKEEKKVMLKPLPSGWTTRYTSDGMLVYLDHVNERAQFKHPSENPWKGSMRSIAAVLGSDTHNELNET